MLKLLGRIKGANRLSRRRFLVVIVTHFIRKAVEDSQKTVVFHLGGLVKNGKPKTFLWLCSMKQQTTVSPVILAEPIAGLSA